MHYLKKKKFVDTFIFAILKQFFWLVITSNIFHVVRPFLFVFGLSIPIFYIKKNKERWFIYFYFFSSPMYCVRLERERLWCSTFSYPLLDLLISLCLKSLPVQPFLSTSSPRRLYIFIICPLSANIPWYYFIFSYIAVNAVHFPQSWRIYMKQQECGCTERWWGYHLRGHMINDDDLETRATQCTILFNIRKSQLKSWVKKAWLFWYSEDRLNVREKRNA